MGVIRSLTFTQLEGQMQLYYLDLEWSWFEENGSDESYTRHWWYIKAVVAHESEEAAINLIKSKNDNIGNEDYLQLRSRHIDVIGSTAQNNPEIIFSVAQSDEEDDDNNDGWYILE
ncbi:MAG: hypothetical protein FJZ43_00070 [Candidatus Staskawiczbacteria bacterium]|nr:hypothetical protein [Candidatus Staskawiczbacteria bacterium]